MKLKILDKRIGAEFPLPSHMSEGAAGLDLRAMVNANTLIYPGAIETVGTGIAIHIENKGLAGLVLPRSGLGRIGLVLSNIVGLIDSDYQGEIILSCWNRSDDAIVIEPGQRIAQLVIVHVEQVSFEVVEDFNTTTERNTGGFGSTKNM